MKHLIYFIPMIFFLLAGCTEEEILTLPATSAQVTITFHDLPDTVASFYGSEINLPVQVSALDGSSENIRGKTVEFSVTSGSGQMTPTQVLTDDFGFAGTRLSSMIPQGFRSTRISATINGFTGSKSIILHGRDHPAAINQLEETQIIIRSDESVSKTFGIAVIDSFGRGIPNVELMVSLLPAGGEDSAPGYFSSIAPTDHNGRTQVMYHNPGESGLVMMRTEIAASNGLISSIYALTTISIVELPRRNRQFIMTADPDYLEPEPDSTARSVIRVIAKDENLDPIPSLEVQYSTNLGTLANPGLTDDKGVSEVAIYFRNEYGLATITATAPERHLTTQTSIQVNRPRVYDYHLELISDKALIYADNGLSYATLTAVLKDEIQQAVEGDTLYLSCTHGAVQSPVVTNSLGVAKAVFSDAGQPSLNPDTNEPEPAVITVRSVNYGSIATAEVMIEEISPVTDIYLSSDARSLIANSGRTTAVRATCRLTNGSTAPIGTEVHFNADYGRFSHEMVTVSGPNGLVENEYTAGNIVAKDSLYAWVEKDGSRTESNKFVIDLVPGDPYHCRLTAVPPELSTNDPLAFSTITATLTDTFANPVQPGIAANFTTTTGLLRPAASMTDANGQASTQLYTNGQAGLAQIEAQIDSDIHSAVTVTFVSGIASSISLSPDPLEIQIRGTGGIQTSTIEATIRDPFGNIILYPVTVVFELVNGHELEGWPKIVRAEGGHAGVSYRAGTLTGVVQFRAYTWPDSVNHPDEIIEAFCNVVVVSGPPFQLDIDVTSAGIDAGGGAWNIEVSARVWDIHRNPVGDRIPVVFTVDPEIANISPGFTGNNSRNGHSSPGMAFASLIYHSRYTYSPIEISAEVQTVRGQITGSREYRLPLQEGNLILQVDPANWLFDEDNDAAEIRCWAVLTDGHDIRINNAPILFRSNHGQFFWRIMNGNNDLLPFSPNPVRKYTGQADRNHNEEAGEATVYLLGVEEDFFIDPFAVERVVRVEAQVEGQIDMAEPQFITFTRR